MVTTIFGTFLIVGIIYSLITGNITIANTTLISSGEKAIELSLKMIPLLCLWLGIMKIV